MKTISREEFEALFKNNEADEEFEKQNVFGTGAENTGFAQYFYR